LNELRIYARIGSISAFHVFIRLCPLLTLLVPCRWVAMHSHELNVGEAKPIEFMGHSLVVFRGENGVASVLDAYCPHLGANLGVDSRIVGNTLECPFHGWQFNQEGKCTSIPGQSMIPESAQLRKWHVQDINDKIIVWHHADKKEPDWLVPDFVEEFDFHGKSEHTVCVHVQEIAENGPDVSHLNFLHKSWLGSSIRTFVHHKWDATWTPGTEEHEDKHLAYITVSQEMASFGRSIPFTKNTVKILQVGPGMVHLDFPLPFGLHVRIMETVTPAAPMLQRVRHSIYASKCTPRIFAKIFLALMIRIFEQDVAIWNNKTYQAKPMYAKPDRAIPVYRRWYQQFYSESSPQASALLNPLEW
jgi:cholesterol 7-dehydrogenase